VAGRSGETTRGAPPLTDPSSTNTLPVFHVTHWKAGSRWVQGVIQRLAGDRFVPVKADMSHITREPIRPTGVYSPVYLRRDHFLAAVAIPHRRFFVIRDLRDALVSWYFSLTRSHGPNPVINDVRAALQGLDKEPALLHLISERLQPMANIQSSWIGQGETILRYEDMLADEQAAFEIIARLAGLEVHEKTRRAVVAAHSFEKTAGRPRGQEDPAAHRRKAIAGDWRNHFSPAAKSLFKERFGQLLIDTGYEHDLDW
jgi:hypothetical protein